MSKPTGIKEAALWDMWQNNLPFSFESLSDEEQNNHVVAFNKMIHTCYVEHEGKLHLKQTPKSDERLVVEWLKTKGLVKEEIIDHKMQQFPKGGIVAGEGHLDEVVSNKKEL